MCLNSRKGPKDEMRHQTTKTKIKAPKQRDRLVKHDVDRIVNKRNTGLGLIEVMKEAENHDYYIEFDKAEYT